MSDKPVSGDFLSRYGLYDGVWLCYECKTELGTHAATSICPNAEWELAKQKQQREALRTMTRLAQEDGGYDPPGGEPFD